MQRMKNQTQIPNTHVKARLSIPTQVGRDVGSVKDPHAYTHAWARVCTHTENEDSKSCGKPLSMGSGKLHDRASARGCC